LLLLILFFYKKHQSCKDMILESYLQNRTSPIVTSSWEVHSFIPWFSEAIPHIARRKRHYPRNIYAYTDAQTGDIDIRGFIFRPRFGSVAM